MKLLLLVCGLVFLVAGAAGLVAPFFSERRRRTAEVMGIRPVHQLLLAVPGALLTIGAVAESRWTVGTGIGGLVVGVIVSRRLLDAIDDPPPAVARLRERPVNPLRQLRHPIEDARATGELLKLRRNRREHREWEVRRGLRPPPAGPPDAPS